MKTLGLIFLVALATSSFAQNEGDPMVSKNFKELDWKPKKALPPGAMSASAYGDPTKGNYDFYGKFPAKYTVPNHWHSFDCNVVIIKGSMTIKREGLSDVTIKQGGFFTLPGEMKYIAYCSEECIFLVHGEKPFDLFYSNPKDDPRNDK